MKVAWVLGWAVPEAWFAPMARAALPQAEHVFVEAGPGWWEQLRDGAPWDAVVGYSLGSLLLLGRAAEVSAVARHVALLAPVRAFAKEEGLGGTVARAQVKYLARWVRTDRGAALADFYARAGLSGCAASMVESATETLVWGLEKLATGRAEAMPDGWRAYAGEQDALMSARELKALDERVTVVSVGNHHPEALIVRWAAELS